MAVSTSAKLSKLAVVKPRQIDLTTARTYFQITNVHSATSYQVCGSSPVHEIKTRLAKPCCRIEPGVRDEPNNSNQCSTVAVSLRKCNSYSAMNLSRQRNGILGCKQNPGQPVNDLFGLRTDVQPQKQDAERDVVKGCAPVEKASGPGLECGHGGSEHDQPVCNPKQLPLPE